MRIAILISGGGSTAEAIINATRTGDLMGLVDVACVIASNDHCTGLGKARDHGIPTHVVNPRTFTNRDDFGVALLHHLVDNYSVDGFGQHGWMPITPSKVVTRFLGRTLNQHPGPLDPGWSDFGGVNPGMFGARVSCARLYFCRQAEVEDGYWTEATTHLVEEGVDTGQLVHTERVRIETKDDVNSLQERLLPVEHRVCIEAWRQMATDTARPHTREERLVQWEHRSILSEAKRIAEILYPRC